MKRREDWLQEKGRYSWKMVGQRKRESIKVKEIRIYDVKCVVGFLAKDAKFKDFIMYLGIFRVRNALFSHLLLCKDCPTLETKSCRLSVWKL